MSSPAAVERVRFVHGQRLRADDLGDAAGGELRRQELHVVAAHRTWGIAAGLEAARRGAAGARVRAGAAFDRLGRALVLCDDTSVTLPAGLAGAAGPVVLVVALRDGCPAVRFAGQGDVRPGLDVPLAAFAIADGKLGDADLGCRHAARSLARARVGTGSATVTVDPAAWPAPASGFVDTSVAGFVRDPSYVVTRVSGDDTGASSPDTGGGFVWIADPQPDGFTVCLWAPAGGPKEPYDLQIDWLGAEPPPGCPPVPKLL